MTNEIITTLKFCMASIQLNLFNRGVLEPKFEEVLTKKFTNSSNIN